MQVLLLRPVPANERFGLGPFFRIEPLGMEYVAAALEAAGHAVTVADLRFGRSLEHYLRTCRPRVVGVACMHALETDDARALIDDVRRLSPDAIVVVGGHSAAHFPEGLFDTAVDAIVVDDGERAMPALVAAVDKGRPLSRVPGLVVRTPDGFVRTADPGPSVSLDVVPLPARHHVDAWRRQYACLAHRPTFLIETARGCPFRCSFCSVWQMYDRQVRERGIDAVCGDVASVGDHVFIADDLFFHHRSRSAALAKALLRRGLQKQWVLVQTRVDTVAREAALLETWKPFAREFDVFFGLEAPTDDGLTNLSKDTTVARMRDGIRIARELGYGVTGNFVVDPAWDQHDFERLWEFVAQERLWNAGYTILTPLPGTAYFTQSQPRLRAVDWAQFDMHHLLWEPKLGAQRFFELYCETWRRSVLNLGGQKRWWHWLREVEIRNAWFLVQALRRTQQMLDPRHYLAEHRLASTTGFPKPGRAARWAEPQAGCDHQAADAS
jgi:hopanoid C-3 methylase